MDCVTRISHEILLRFTQNTPALECTHDRERILRQNLTLEWRRQGKYRWMFATWPSWRRLMHVQKFHWHPWTHYVRCLDIRDISIWASSCYISWNVSVSESRLEMCHLKREIFRGSHCDQNDERSRDTDLTIHVNVTTKDNYRLCQRNRTMKDHLILIWVGFDTWRNVVSRCISHWIVLCKIRNMTRTNTHTHHENHKNNQRHYHTHEHTNFRSITWTKTPALLKIVTQKTRNQFIEWANDQTIKQRFFSVQFWIGPFCSSGQTFRLGWHFFLVVFCLPAHICHYVWLPSAFTHFKLPDISKIYRKSSSWSTATSKIRLTIWPSD